MTVVNRVLLAGLGLSLLVTALTCRRLLAGPAPAPRVAVARDPAPPVVPREADAKADQLAAELAALRRDLRALREPEGAPADLVVAAALAEQDRARVFWKDLRRLETISDRVDPAELRRLICAATAEFLGIDKIALAAAAERMIQEIVAAERKREQDQDALDENDDLDPDDHDRRTEEIEKVEERALEAARRHVTALLDVEGKPRHKAFAGRLDEWGDRLRSADFDEE
jgi:hypothetical protein